MSNCKCSTNVDLNKMMNDDDDNDDVGQLQSSTFLIDTFALLRQ